MMALRKYFKSWLILTTKSFQVELVSRFSTVLFIAAKIFRFAFFLVFLIILGNNTKLVQNYTLWQMIFFFSVFNLIDGLPQFFLREVYRFRNYVVSGDFDYFLTKPLSPLFRSLFGGADILDIPMILISFGFVIFSAFKIGDIAPSGVLLFAILLLNGCLLAFAIHIFILALGVLTTEIENAVWIYRDVTQLGRIPIDVYKEPLRGLITFVIPVGIMMTFPAKALMGLLSWQFVVISISVSVLILLVSLKFWQFALTKYSSASS